MAKGLRIGATIGMIGFVYQAYQGWKRGGINGVVTETTGWKIGEGRWAPKEANAAIALAAGVGVSFVASKVGANRYTPKGINI